MSPNDPNLPNATPSDTDTATDSSPRPRSGRLLRILAWIVVVVAILATAAFFIGRHYVHTVMQKDLPQLDGTVIVYGLSAPVTVQRDAQGVPHIQASSLDDLVFAQGYVTAQDRLWQMELLRRHAAGELAAVLGPAYIEHDRLQRTLLMRVVADHALAALPADQKHWLEVYARGVNASISAQRGRLPLEFRLLAYTPSPWTPRDSLLVELALYQDLTTGFWQKLGREAITAKLSPDLIADLYPVGSWRDHWPGKPTPDVTAIQPEFQDIPLDASQITQLSPATKPGAPEPALSLSKGLPPETWESRHLSSGAPSIAVPSRWVGRNPLKSHASDPRGTASNLLALQQATSLTPSCPACTAGSNAWAVSGAHSASGKPLLSNDTHLAFGIPGIWYEADLEATNPAPLVGFHAAGVTLPGAPFVVIGHNDHVAWGFTNLGADIQDLYIEHTRGTPTGAEYQTANGIWRPMRYLPEVIHVRGASDVKFEIPLTHHGNTDLPVISSVFPGELRTLSLRWSIYDPANISVPTFAVDSATDWPSMLDALANCGGPPENLIYADDQGHIGYHAIGHIPLRGDLATPSALAPIPTDSTAPDAATHEWAGYIPFDQLPQSFDPPGGVLATANARITPDNYPYPITLDWKAPYRTERIYKVLEPTPAEAALTPPHPFTPADMLALQNDVHSELDQIVAQRLVYSIDHATGPLKDDKTLHQAADLMRNWNGSVDANSAAPAIVNVARTAFWPMLLIPKLTPQLAARVARGDDLSKDKTLPADVAHDSNLWTQYTWGERDFVLEELITKTPARWLPPTYATWEDFLAAVVARGLRDAHAPSDLSTWRYGAYNPIDIEHPFFSRSPLVRRLIAVPTGTGPQPHSGDLTTVKQLGPTFGPSQRLTVDLGNLDATTLNLVLGQSGNPLSPWYMDQFPAWLSGKTYPLPFTPSATLPTVAHTLTLTPR
jgi:penicillin amidase